MAVTLPWFSARDTLARQRTLHELAVVALLLKEHGPSLAERFLLHEIIETCIAAERYEKYYGRLEYQTFPVMRNKSGHSYRQMQA